MSRAEGGLSDANSEGAPAGAAGGTAIEVAVGKRVRQQTEKVKAALTGAQRSKKARLKKTGSAGCAAAPTQRGTAGGGAALPLAPGAGVARACARRRWRWTLRFRKSAQRLNGNAVMQPSRCAVNATVHGCFKWMKGMTILVSSLTPLPLKGSQVRKGRKAVKRKGRKTVKRKGRNTVKKTPSDEKGFRV